MGTVTLDGSPSRTPRDSDPERHHHQTTTAHSPTQSSGPHLTPRAPWHRAGHLRAPPTSAPLRGPSQGRAAAGGRQTAATCALRLAAHPRAHAGGLTSPQPFSAGGSQLSGGAARSHSISPAAAPPGAATAPNPRACPAKPGLSDTTAGGGRPRAAHHRSPSPPASRPRAPGAPLRAPPLSPPPQPCAASPAPGATAGDLALPPLAIPLQPPAPAPPPGPPHRLSISFSLGPQAG